MAVIGGIDHFKLLVGIASFEQSLQNAAKAEFRLGIPMAADSPKTKTRTVSGGLICNDEWKRLAGPLRAEKTPAETVVFHEAILAAIFIGKKKETACPKPAKRKPASKINKKSSGTNNMAASRKSRGRELNGLDDARWEGDGGISDAK